MQQLFKHLSRCEFGESSIRIGRIDLRSGISRRRSGGRSVKKPRVSRTHFREALITLVSGRMVIYDV